MKLSLIAGMLAAFGLSFVAAQSDADCSKSSLNDAQVEQMEMYDKDLYLEEDCVNGATPLPIHCNYLGLGQECRGCYTTCEGAAQYLEDFADEYAVWGDRLINFCPGAEVEDYSEC